MQLLVKHFTELSAAELYAILRARQDVFVVEQNCPFPEIDGKDLDAYHLWFEENGEILAYARVLDRGVSFETPAVGRVISIRRREGLGSRILSEGIRIAREKYSAEAVMLEAQVYARKLYEKQGFVQVSEEFLEDGIPHIIMRLEL
ncbi:MAG TPA: GNAT family N-acetyltransferase [Methanocorpusculum sp.]|nr:GNAT family N-acetyltransferase [Methanocorpusculum sp.]HJJ69394.1 GNAT family N-acetyltransferase [Methanocorpusculum sp.]HJJ76133.1 GNAT family N-acetyltransferase [Methanocorpusculum sp.]